MGSIYRRDNRWGIDYVDHRSVRIRRVVAADKSVALHLLAEAMAVTERVKAGILEADPREARRPIREPLEQYLADLVRRGRDDMYHYNVRKHLEAAIASRRWRCLRDCTPRSIAAHLADLSSLGRSARTVNAHRADLSAFFAWCVRNGILERNPCDRVAKNRVIPEKKRRALSIEECRSLLAAAPPERAAVYQFMLATGLRRAEAAAICWCHLHLDAANPYVELPGAITKSRKPETVPLAPDLAQSLRERRGRSADLVFSAIPSMPQFRTDLAHAGIAEVDERGRRVVLHSLRHSLATMLAKSQVPPAVAQKIMRHRDVKLTLEAYTDEGQLPAAAAIASLPRLSA